MSLVDAPDSARPPPGDASIAPRLAIVLSHPTQYYSPWFRSLSARTALTFRVFYLWEFGVAPSHDREFGKTFRWDVDLLAGYDAEFVPNRARDPGTHHFGGLHNPDLVSRLSAWRPTALLCFGYKWSAHLRAIAWARWRGVPLIFRGDSHLLSRPRQRPFTRAILHALFAQFRAVTYVGAANRAYFTDCGVPAARLFFAPHAVDAELFRPTPESLQRAAALRAQLGLAADTRVVLFAGKLIPLKETRMLLGAFMALRPTNAVLVFVGDGREKQALVELARAASAGTVHFLPFANQSEMPAHYLLADLLALPSNFESWGLVVNEAMHLGVPALVSDRVGCQQDLVTDGETGWVFISGQATSLREKLGVALASVADVTTRERMRAAVTQRIARYTYARTTEGLLAALASVQRPNGQ